MKKIALFSLVLAGLISSECVFAGNVTEACYAVTSCGGKVNAEWIGGFVGGSTGSATGSIFSPFGAVAGMVAGGYHGEKLGAKIGRNYSANEYIYFDDGSCLECDNHQVGEDFECPNRTIVTNGGKAYMCHVEGSGDYWQEYTIPVCTDSPFQPGDIKDNDGRKYKTFIKDNLTNNGKSVKPGVVVFSGAACIYVQEDCDCADCCKKPDPKPGPNKKSCDDLYKNYPERNACCKAGNATKWVGDLVSGKCICKDINKEWKNGRCVDKVVQQTCETMYAGNDEAIACCNLTDSTWIPEIGRCVCNKDTKNWKYDAKTKKGECVDEGTKNEKECRVNLFVNINCADGRNSFYNQYDFRTTRKDAEDCKNWETLLKREISSLSGGAVSAGDYTGVTVEELKNLIYQVCGRGPSADEIAEAKRTLQRFFDNAKDEASVWKKSDGSFNTARLASDLTAGVVLGTVGGVISGHVIKKNQIKKGFEVLHCTVGGHIVANWGDEFSVGLLTK